MSKTLKEGRKSGSGRKPGSVSFVEVDISNLANCGKQFALVSRVWAEKNNVPYNRAAPANDFNHKTPPIELKDCTTDNPPQEQ